MTGGGVPEPLIAKTGIWPVGARLRHFVAAWSALTRDPWVLSVVAHGFRLPLASQPPLTCIPLLTRFPRQH